MSQHFKKADYSYGRLFEGILPRGVSSKTYKNPKVLMPHPQASKLLAAYDPDLMFWGRVFFSQGFGFRVWGFLE